MLRVNVDLNPVEIYDQVSAFLSRKKGKKIPFGKFIRELERDYSSPFSKGTKSQIRFLLEQEGRLFTTSRGKTYVTKTSMAGNPIQPRIKGFTYRGLERMF